jgi:hypothetical protein
MPALPISHRPAGAEANIFHIHSISTLLRRLRYWQDILFSFLSFFKKVS